MQETIISFKPTDADVSELKAQVAEARRQHEFAKLKTALAEITHQSVNTPDEFAGAMQMPDTEQVLKTKRQQPRLVELVLGRLGKMCGVRPVIGNLIGIGVALLALYVIQHEVILNGFAQYKPYFGIGLLIFAGIQVVKSGTRSVLLPLVATLGGAIVSHLLPHGHLLFGHTAKFYQYVMIVGVVGLGISVLNID